jgi:Xaa-Pro aminopeptidase
MDTRTSTVRQRVADLQARLHHQQIDAVLVPSSDPHLSEYLPARWQGRERFSGFTGSMGTLVVLADRAVVFADSRYWVQAEAELQGTGVALEKIATGDANAHVGWLARQLSRGATLAVDGSVLALAAAQQLKAALSAQGVQVRTDLDLLDGAWIDRPALPTAAVYEHRPPHAPTPRAQKLEQVRRAMALHGATHHFISTVDDIAWLTNLRGADVNYNPVFVAHLLVERLEEHERATLFTSEGKIDAALAQALAADGVTVAPYTQAAAALGELPPDSTLLVDPRRITLAFRQAVPEHVAVVEAINPSTLAKSRKTDAEAAFVREAMERDGAAMCAFYAWFETALGREAISELTIDERLSAQRQTQPGFVSLSFPTIAGFNGNGAMPHYRATPASHAQISGPTGLAAQGLLLIDSGAQYLGGTTDITRVWPIGQTTPAQRRDFTLVLKGMIALSRTRFPRGTLSPMLDAIARAPLWEQRLDYGHGTGHGVGYFLNVHEGPQSISRALAEPHMAMQPGMITSNEPGLYRPGQWGVRIENLLLNVPDQTSEFGEFLAFETLTLCPIDTRCLDRSLLREDELAWLNAYHAEVLRRLRPHVNGEARAWLETRSAAL